MIEYFEKLLLEKEARLLEGKQDGARQILYVFCQSDRKLDCQSLVCQLFGQRTRWQIFKKAQKYVILKVITNRGLDDFSNSKRCIFSPSMFA